MTDEQNIQQIVSWFFDKINNPIIESFYIDNSQNWDAICSSLTILNDLQRPKKEYYCLKKINHLEAIGIMQTIYIEQDCMLTLQNAILEQTQKEHLTNYTSIRSIRNEAFGHPSEKKKNKQFSRHFFDIADSEKQILKIIDWKTTGNIESYHFDLTETVKKNSKITNDYLEDIKIKFITKIKNKLTEFKIKVSDLFSGASYIFEKLLTKHNDRIVIDTYFTIDEDLEKAKEGLIERQIFDNCKKEFEALVFFSTKLKPLFYIQTYDDIEFYAYAITLRQGIANFKKSIKDIDEIF